MDRWPAAWAAAPPGAPIDHEIAAVALGADWFVFCDSTGTITARRLRRAAPAVWRCLPTAVRTPGTAVGWWAVLLSGEYGLEDAEAAVPARGGVDWGAYPPGRAAAGVSLLEAGESFAVTAEAAGWAWVRIPWDPYWHAHSGTPVLEGGPGHLVVWVEEGRNDFGWWVPRRVDVAAKSAAIDRAREIVGILGEARWSSIGSTAESATATPWPRPRP